MLTGRVSGLRTCGRGFVFRGFSKSAATRSFHSFASSSRVAGVAETDAARERSGVRMKLLDHSSRELGGIVPNATNGNTTPARLFLGFDNLLLRKKWFRSYFLIGRPSESRLPCAAPLGPPSPLPRVAACIYALLRSQGAMPPKKKAEEAPPPEPDASVENVPDPRLLEQKAMVERELAASHLAARLARYQFDAAELVDERAALMDELESIRASAGDATAKLSGQLRGKNATVASLNARLAELNAEREAAATRGEARLAQVHTESAERRHAMVADLAARDALVAQLNSFDDGRETALAELLEKEQLLRNARAAHEDKTRALETETRLAKQQMKEDLARKIRETKAEMKKTTDRQLAGTTKLTIAENEQMLGEMRYRQREGAAMEDRRKAFAAATHAAKDSLRISLNEEVEIGGYNASLSNELRRLEGTLAGERAASALERNREVKNDEAGNRFQPKTNLAKRASTGAHGKSAGTRHDDGTALLNTLARRMASAAAERDELQAELQALQLAVGNRDDDANTESEREYVVAFLRQCAQDLEQTEGDEGSDETWRQRKRIVNTALEGIRLDAGVEEMLTAMVREG